MYVPCVDLFEIGAYLKIYIELKFKIFNIIKFIYNKKNYDIVHLSYALRDFEA